jgi:peptide/nickel transport system substrate-binding protein
MSRMSSQRGRGRRAAAGAALAAGLLAGCGGPAASPRPDQVVVAYPSTLTTFHPTLVSDEFSYSIASNVFEPLVDVGSRQGLRPGLAVAWHNLDELTWRFELRPDAAFHDGRRVDAASVVAALERARLDPALRMTFVLDPVERFSAAGDGAVEVRTRFPMPDLAARLIELGVWAEPWTADEPPAGSGPYRVASWRPEGEVVLERVSGGGPRRLVFRGLM